ncbi:MAG: hypothetical protein LC657_14465, partial [Desulfobacteraceae bacterium]|nr:hypothetical protein [Desulfobacteraceae bacterium]
MNENSLSDSSCFWPVFMPQKERKNNINSKKPYGRETMALHYSTDFQAALDFGRPPNVKTLFPHSKALIVSGKY